MVLTRYPIFNDDDVAGFGSNTGPRDSNFDSDGHNLNLSNTAGPSQPNEVWEHGGSSQPYAGVEVWGDLNSYPNFNPALLNPNSTPRSPNPTDGGVPGGGCLPSSHLHAAVPVFPFGPTVPSLDPKLSLGAPYLPATSYTTHTTPTYHQYAQPHILPSPEKLLAGHFAVGGRSSLPATLVPLDYNLLRNKSCGQFLQSGPPYHNVPSFDSVTDMTPPEHTPPTPVASSSGPQRTVQPAREARRHDPVKPAEKVNPKQDREGWDQTLARFQTEFDAQRKRHSGPLEPAMALAMIEKIIKGDLKRSPLRDTAAAAGRRGRDVEDYVKYLLSVLLPKPPTEEGESDDDEALAILSRLASELEGKLVAVNETSALRPDMPGGKMRQEKVVEMPRMEATDEERQLEEKKAKRLARKRQTEKERRSKERCQMERVALLFKVPENSDWTRKDALSLGVLFVIYGPTVFTSDLVQPRAANTPSP